MTVYDKMAHMEKYADPRCPYRLLAEAEEPDEVPVRHSPETLKRLADFIKHMAGFSAAHPKAWESLRLKLDRPELSCREIAGKLGITHPTVRKHLQAAVKAVPELKRVLRINNNNQSFK